MCPWRGLTRCRAELSSLLCRLTPPRQVIPKLDATLASIVAAGPEQFDLERITNFIDQEVNYMMMMMMMMMMTNDDGQVVSNLKDAENSPHLFVPDATVLDQLYGERPGDLETFVKLSQANKQYQAKDSAFWIDLIRKHFMLSLMIFIFIFIVILSMQIRWIRKLALRFHQ